jgi:hypothetical protein
MKQDKLYQVVCGRLYTNWEPVNIFSKNKDRLIKYMKKIKGVQFRQDYYGMYYNEDIDWGFRIVPAELLIVTDSEMEGL